MRLLRNNAVIAGVIFITAYYLPFFILWENAYLNIWDQLDSEIVFNISQTRHFFTFSGTIPELINIDVRALNTFSVFQLPFYTFLPPFAAYLANDIIVRITAYIGMYLFMDLLLDKERRFFSVTAAILFASIPFFSTYGLSSAGLPLIIWVFWQIYNRQRLLLSYILIIYFTASSSIFLTGYFIIGFLALFCLYFLFKKEHRKSQLHFYLAFLLMLTLYLIINAKFISLLLEGYASHRERWNGLSVLPDYIPHNDFPGFIEDFIIKLTFGHSHMRSYHTLIFGISILAVIVGYKNHGHFWRLLRLLLAINLLIALTAALLFTEFAGSALSLLGLNFFNFTRIFHLSAVTWYAAAGVSFLIISDKLQSVNFRFKKTAVTALASACLIFTNSWPVSFEGRNEPYLANYLTLFGYKSPTAPTYRQFYDERLFNEIRDHIGIPQSDYRVGSIGIHPAVAIFNGFYTVDAYIQNYSLEYWHKFREIIAPELDKCADLTTHFNWGNQCYLFTVNTGRFFTYPKHADTAVGDLSYNLRAFAGLGGRYILSAVPIIKINGVPVEHSTEMAFLRSFEHAESWWRIYLYEVTP
jgi:hypothetical protein